MRESESERPRSDASLQPAGQLDAPVIAALQNETFPQEPWSQRSVSELIAGADAVAWVAVGRDYGETMPLGFALGRIAADEAELLAVGVLPEARGKGLGRRLVEAVADRARAAGAGRLHLEVSEANAAARRMYEVLGFRQVGRRKGYYADPGGTAVDALLLAREL